MADLTLKQRKWIDAYIQTGNATEAARRAGYAGSDETLGVIGHENLKKLKLEISDLMDRMGLSDAFLLGKLVEGLEAMSVKTATDHGVISDERAYVDYPTRQSYLDMALKLKGRYPDAKLKVVGDPVEPVVVKVLNGVSMDDL